MDLSLILNHDDEHETRRSLQSGVTASTTFANTLTPQRTFFDLPAEIRNMVYTLLVVPPGGCPLGSFEDCNRMLCSSRCFDRCLRHKTRTSEHFQHEWATYRCLDESLSSKQLYHELSAVFYSNTFEFHNTADMYRFLRLATPKHADQITKISLALHIVRPWTIPNDRWMFPMTRFSTVKLMQALHWLVKCENLKSYEARLEFRILRPEITKRLAAWLARDTTDGHRRTRYELY